MNYTAYINSSAWERKKAAFRETDEYTGRCYCCKSFENIHIHHITYERLGDESMDDLVAVCRKCHRLIHEMAKVMPRQYNLRNAHIHLASVVKQVGPHNAEFAVFSIKPKKKKKRRKSRRKKEA